MSADFILKKKMYRVDPDKDLKIRYLSIFEKSS